MKDMETMFRLIEEMQKRWVHVYVRRLSVGLGCGIASSGSNYGKEMVQFNDDVGGGSGLDDG